MVQPESSPRPSTIRILHIDDEATPLKYTKAFLERADESFHVESVASPEDALERLKSETFDCVISDFMMSPMDGIEVARRIRESSDIPIILYTGRGSEEVAEAAFRIGIDDYIRKEMNPSHYQVLTRRIIVAVDKHRAERALQRQLKEMQIILDSAPIIIFYKDRENRLVKVNQALVASSGLSMEELVGRDLSEIYPDLADDYWKDDLEVIETGVPILGIIEPLETPEGVRWLITDKIPYRNENDEITGVIGFSSDITEQKRMEEELRRSEERLRGFMDSATEEFRIFDSELNFLDVNNAALVHLGLKKEEVIGRNLKDVNPYVEESGRYDQYLEVIRTGEPLFISEASSGPQAGDRILSISAFKVQEGLGLISTDITETKRFEVRLEALHRHATELTSVESVEEIAEATLNVIEGVFGFQWSDFNVIKDDRIIPLLIQDEALRSNMELPLDGPGIITRAYRTGESQLVHDTRLDDDYVIGRDEGGEEWISELAVPVKIGDEVVAVINVEDKKLGAFTPDDQKLLEVFAEHVASAIDRLEQMSALRTSEDKFRTLLEESRDAILVLDRERYLYGNSKAAELLGFSDPSELIGRDAFEFVAPEDREKVRETTFRRQSGEVVPNRYEFNLVNREGKRIPVEANVSLIEYNGKPASLTINRDITERRRAEEALKASEAKYRSFLEEGLDGVVVTRNGEYLYINQRYAEMLGYSDPSELLGRNTRELIDPRDAELLDAIREQRQRGDMQRFIYEVRSLKKDGSSIWVGVASSGIEFEGNQAVITYARDITERKRMEEDTKQYQKRLEALHSSSFRLSKHDHLNGMFMETLDIIKDVLGFQYLGIAQIKGDEITFDAAVEAYQPGDFRIPLSQPSIVGRVFKTGKPELISDTRHDPDYYFDPEMDEAEQRLSMLAVPVMVEGEVVAVIDVEGVKTGAFSEEDRKILEILADHVASAMERIQSRRRLEELHEQHNRELVDGVQRVSSMVRHDLRGPLQTIMNAAYIAETNPKKISEMMEIIMRSVKHQSDIMEDWKNQDLTETLNTTEEDLSQLISDSLAASLIPSHITVDVNVDPMNVTLDNVKMRRVMDNLIRNAIEAMEDGGRLTISAREAKDEIVIEVTDTGIGIPETEMKNLFKPFYTTKPSGIGLGLTYCRRTVEAHKGTIELESKAGEGTKITISMPKTPEAE
jgi:PAS domain S-box-containing protein